MRETSFNLTEIHALHRRGAIPEALELLLRHLQDQPSDIDAVKLCAETYFRLGLREEGFQRAIQAYDLKPGDIGYGLDCAFNLVRAGRRSDALAIAGKLAAQSPDDPYHRDALGSVYTHCGDPGSALVHFQYACSKMKTSPEFLYNLASVQRMVGAVSDAEANLDKAIAIQPKDGALYFARSSLRKQTEASNHVDQLRTAIAGLPDQKSRIAIGYALAKELEDIGSYRDGFAELSLSSRLQRAATAYDSIGELGLMEGVGSLDYSRSAAAAKACAADRRPIFVMGLPRSGTTLVERIIASVPGVSSVGESNVLAAELWRLASRGGRPADPNGAMIDAIGSEALAIGANYLRSFENGPRGAFIDKTPNNYLLAGLIKTAFSDARIICLRRNAMDSCFALYKSLFADGAYPFSYDLTELAQYYVAWDRLICTWEQYLGDAWLTVKYEDLVGLPEPTMRTIIDHCGLEWSDQCLDFDQLATPVTTASAGQVSRPLHQQSVALWRHYAEELKELSDVLRDHDIAVE